jgi:feruloyl esterase
MRFLVAGLCAVVTAVSLGRPVVVAAPSCESLASLALPAAHITRAQLVPAGRFAGTPDGVLAPGAQAFKPYNALPEFCRVMATLTPTSDSSIAIEVWMPAAGWNGKFLGLGNGGFGGQISVQQLALSLMRGYAVAQTDTGHPMDGGSGRFAFNHPEKLIDLSYRAVHEMTLKAKTLISAYLGAALKLSYWDGCSTGGRQGLKEAQRYPEDYDGIIAGAPANFMTHMLAAQLKLAQVNLKDAASRIPPKKFPAIHAAALEQCDALDGVKDGAIEDPTQCHFDPASMQCAGAETNTCLTAPQVATARQVYAPLTDPKTGAEFFPGLEPGRELGWAGGVVGPQPFWIPVDYFRFIVFKNPSWDFRAFDASKDVAIADALDNGADNATDPHLAPFFARGGKLLMYHGWADQLIAPRNTVNYYRSVVSATPGAADAMRLFMMPDMQHCAVNFDKLTVMEQWVEEKRAPERIVASHITAGKVDRMRPLCPYPQVATYSGAGSMSEAASFECKSR